MSFFGFDASGPQHANATQNTNSYDFQDTYEGLGELDEDDALNSETFGVGNVSKDFDFSATSQAAKPVAQVNPAVSYARAAANDAEFMHELWGVDPPAPVQQNASVPAATDTKKVLSLQEIEAQLTAIDAPRGPPHQPPPPQPYFQGYPPQYPYMVPQGFMPPPGQFVPYPGFVPMQGMMGHVPAAAPPPPEQRQPPQPQQMALSPQQPLSAPQTAPAAPAAPAAPQQQMPVPQQNASAPPALPVGGAVAPETDLSQFPVLGAKGTIATRPKEPTVGQDTGRGHVAAPEVSEDPEREHERWMRRQEKLGRIMRYSGVMNPKDKDFVTRFQLLQIVTDDPYNEDFYAQVYKVIHPKSTSSVLAPPAQQANLIAQAYLDQSGHRLGGRHRRADVALQRMQLQVQKAVTVAKERQKLPQHVREGVLGKISVGSGKKPRQQLTILSKAAQKAKESEEREKEGGEGKGAEKDGSEQDAESGSGSEITGVAKTRRSPLMAAAARPSHNYSKKDILAILENIINQLMSVESESRLTSDVDTTALWESLHVLDHTSLSGDDVVNPFVQCLNYAKALKMLPRLFKFLNRDQILAVVTLIMSNLENLTVIKDGSYTTYDDRKVPEKAVRLVDIYTLTLSKVLMNAVQDFRFAEIISLLRIVVHHNVVSFVSTTKIGLSILTTLLSRAELMKGEGTISATDLSAWTSCYDELFTALESRIAAIFPPGVDDVDDDYVWQFLATLSLGGKLSHQRIIVEEVRDEIFGVMTRAKAIDNSDMANLYKKQAMLNNLNMYLVVMGLVADENEIQELKT